jgi:Uri superfamily endonuclease
VSRHHALVLAASIETNVQIGRLGSFSVQPGCYVYIGSAFGPGGLRARLARHRQINQRRHWHIDYLRHVAYLCEIWYTADPTRREHLWAQMFGRLPGASIPLPGFGASDCACPTHLYRFATPPAFGDVQRELHRVAPDHGEICAEQIV